MHGHDEAMLQSVARFLEPAYLEPVILKVRAGKGDTIIEKIERCGDVGFAVILLSPDDHGSKVGEALQPRARQNVLLELGYFFGRFGRENVCALRKGDVEFPTDFAGVVWEAFDDAGAALARNLAHDGSRALAFTSPLPKKLAHKTGYNTLAELMPHCAEAFQLFLHRKLDAPLPNTSWSRTRTQLVNSKRRALWSQESCAPLSHHRFPDFAACPPQLSRTRQYRW